MLRCFFIGHRDAPDALQPLIEKTVTHIIPPADPIEFIVGQYGRFDRMSAAAVRRIKTNHPNVRLTLLQCYHPSNRAAPLPNGFDSAMYPFDRPIPHRIAIIRANEYAIRQSDIIIAYALHPGKSRDFLSYAQKQAIHSAKYIINLADAVTSSYNENK